MKIRSTWIPYPGAWLSAVLLLLLTGPITDRGNFLLQIGYPLIQFSPNLGILFSLLTVLIPIFVVAIAHHALHLFEIVIAAYLYQFEHLVHCHLMSLNLNRR